jgi:hypothetical protein
VEEQGDLGRSWMGHSSDGVGWTPGRLPFQSREEQGDLGRGIWGGGRTESAGCWGVSKHPFRNENSCHVTFSEWILPSNSKPLKCHARPLSLARVSQAHGYGPG